MNRSLGFARELSGRREDSRYANGLPARASPDRRRPGGTRAKRGPKPTVTGVFGTVGRERAGLWGVGARHPLETGLRGAQGLGGFDGGRSK